ncbi:hypothetical protein F4X90_22485 [Candidatus Poribacteria bacterium]|nr:hypothetical protein [Candidatus Poribacteria bacterium]
MNINPNPIRSIQIGNRTVNLHNVQGFKCVDVEGSKCPGKAHEKKLVVYFSSGHKVCLYQGHPDICETLYTEINTAMGHHQNFNDIIETNEICIKDIIEANENCTKRE